MDPTNVGQRAAAVFALGFVSRAMQIAKQQQEAKMVKPIDKLGAHKRTEILELSERASVARAVLDGEYIYIVYQMETQEGIARIPKKDAVVIV